MTNLFENKIIVFTGELSIDRDYAKSQILLLGGRCTTAISKKTDFLVVGIEPGLCKLKKAKDLNTKIIYEEEFMKMFNESLFHLKPDYINQSELLIDDDCFSQSSETEIRMLSWVEKYRPKTKKEFIGNQAILNQLTDFLLGKSKEKAALLSGSPGLGKTTSVQMLCRNLNIELIEFNAGDIRNKSSIIANLKGLMNTHSLSFGTTIRRKVVLMDEIDGMTSDRGGLLELTNIIKTSGIPIVCICNDRNNLKIRTLSNYCLDLKFKHPDNLLILKLLKQIVEKEKIVVPDNILSDLIKNGNGDIRYILNSLQCIGLCGIENNFTEDFMKKNICKNIYELISDAFKKDTINNKINLYFEDYSMVPLFVQENYLKCNFKNLKDLQNSADSFSLGDICEKIIRGSLQDWSLAPLYGFFTVVFPTKNKSLYKRVDFPSWLGQYSRQRKFQKNLKEFLIHGSASFRADTEDFRLYDSNVIYGNFIFYLQQGNVEQALKIITDNNLLKEDIMNLGEILTYKVDPYKSIQTKTKSAFSRAYTKLKRKLLYTTDDVRKLRFENSSEEVEY